MTKPKFKTQHSASKRVTLSFQSPSMAKQSFKDECNINNIMKNWENTGLITHVQQHQGQYADLATLPEYHDAQNILAEANQAFASLPSAIRKEFANDPARFLDFAQNPKNIDRMVELGLATNPKPIEEPVKAPKKETLTVSDPAPSTPTS